MDIYLPPKPAIILPSRELVRPPIASVIQLPPTIMAGGVVTYTAFNPADKSVNIALSGGNLIATMSATAQSSVRSISSKSTGKYYWEVTWTTKASDFDDLVMGVGNSSASLSLWPGGDINGWGLQSSHSGAGAFVIKHNGSNTGLTTTGGPVSGDVFMFAWDADAGKFWAGWKGTWLDAGAGAGNPGAGTNPTATSVTGTLFIMVGSTRNLDVWTLNAGSTAFNTAAPSGFGGWST